MPIDATTWGNIRVETNMGPLGIVDLEETAHREREYARNQQRETIQERLQREAEGRQLVADPLPEPEVQPAPKKRKRRTKAEIEADKKRDQKLEEANTKDLKNKNIR